MEFNWRDAMIGERVPDYVEAEDWIKSNAYDQPADIVRLERHS